VLEEAADGVRLMTVHTARGLEFPVVILADMTANLAAADSGSLYRHRSQALRYTITSMRALGADRE